jgi:hypothetical protein
MMAHFAKLSEDNIVLDVIVVNDAWLDDNGTESEAVGIAALQLWSGWPYWAQTSYSNAKRVRYGGIGFTFDRALNAFIPPKPYPSWVLDIKSASWIAPVPMPEVGRWYWDEETGAWIKEAVKEPI